MESTRRIRDKFDRMMEMVRQENQPGIKYGTAKDKPKVIGYYTYNFEGRTENYTSTNKDIK